MNLHRHCARILFDGQFGEDLLQRRQRHEALQVFDGVVGNPRYPLIAEFRAILMDSYYGNPFVELTERPENIATAAASMAKARLDATAQVKAMATVKAK